VKQFLACCLLAVSWRGSAQLQINSTDPVPAVFGGGVRVVQVVIRNPTGRDIEAALRVRILQTSSATVAPLGGSQPWKNLHVLGGQTILESASLSFPAVKAATRCVVQWLDERDHVLGPTEIWIYPDDLLKELKLLAGDAPLGVLDPQNQLKPLLKRLEVEFVDLEKESIERFSGKLAVVGTFMNADQMPQGLERTIRARAKAGVKIVWIQPPAGRLPQLEPKTYLLCPGSGAVVVAHGSAMASLAENPVAQLNLIRLARLSFHPEQLELPDLKP